MGLAQPGVSTPHDVQGWRRTWTVATSPECRGLRVVILLFATFLMGVADLALTLTYVTSIGMVELNYHLPTGTYSDKPHFAALTNEWDDIDL